MSTTPAAPCRRTSKVAVASGMAAPFRAVYGALLVRVDCQEVRQPRDLEDLAVVRSQSEGADLDPCRAGLGQQADDQRDARRVDVTGAAEVEHHRVGLVACGLGPRRLQGRLGGGVDV